MLRKRSPPNSGPIWTRWPLASVQSCPSVFSAVIGATTMEHLDGLLETLEIKFTSEQIAFRSHHGLATGSPSQIRFRLRPASRDSHFAEFEPRAPGFAERKWARDENLPITLEARVTQQSYDLITWIFCSAPDRCPAELRPTASIEVVSLFANHLRPSPSH
jgi:hypothetical protein